jgi:hypothetical protein
MTGPGRRVWWMRMRWMVLGLALVMTAPASPGHAQDGQVYGADQFFRLTWEPVEDGGRLSVSGYVTNNYGLEAINVRLMVESLDASGRVMAKTIGYVNYTIPPSSRGFFEIFPPGKSSSFRVYVLSWDWRRSPSG